MASPRPKVPVTPPAPLQQDPRLDSLIARIDALEAQRHAPPALPPALATFVQKICHDQRVFRKYQATMRRLQGSTNGLLTEMLDALIAE